VDPDTGAVYGAHRRWKGVRLGSPDAYGYLRATGPGRQQVPLHRAVWEAVTGRSQPPGTQLNHLNGVKTDNRFTNLELTDAGGNLAHAYRTGLRPRRQAQRGEAHGRSKLTAAQVAVIRSVPGGRKGVGSRALAAEYGVHRTTIDRIRGGRLWVD
jgi:hypothetical protein